MESGWIVTKINQISKHLGFRKEHNPEPLWQEAIVDHTPSAYTSLTLAQAFTNGIGLPCLAHGAGHGI
jgi:hypothetical protein